MCEKNEWEWLEINSQLSRMNACVSHQNFQFKHIDIERVIKIVIEK